MTMLQMYPALCFSHSQATLQAFSEAATEGIERMAKSGTRVIWRNKHNQSPPYEVRLVSCAVGRFHFPIWLISIGLYVEPSPYM